MSYLKDSTTISSVCPCTPLQWKRFNVRTQKRHLAETESTRKFRVHIQIIHSLLAFYTQTTAQKGRLQTWLCSGFCVHHYRLKIPLRHRLKANFTARSCCPNTSVQLGSPGCSVFLGQLLGTNQAAAVLPKPLLQEFNQLPKFEYR